VYIEERARAKELARDRAVEGLIEDNRQVLERSLVTVPGLFFPKGWSYKWTSCEDYLIQFVTQLDYYL
jgi:hypothetical protein